MDALAQLKSSLAERYDIEREIGAGGMATVYLAHDLRHDRPVALKLLNPELGAVLGAVLGVESLSSMSHKSKTPGICFACSSIRQRPLLCISEVPVTKSRRLSRRMAIGSRWRNRVSTPQVYLRSYPDPSSRIQISASSGREPMWSRDGKTVYYRAGTAEIAARLETSPSLHVVSRNTVVFRTGLLTGGGVSRGNDISRDGRLLGLVTNKDDYQLVVVPNWRVELEKRLAAAKH